jgi:transcription termination/antitermination protein NusA
LIDIKYDADLLKFMSFFENQTRTKIKDCVMTDALALFIVQPGNIGKAIGKNAVNIKKLTASLNRKIKIVEFNPQVEQFIANYIYPLKVAEITLSDGIVLIKDEDMKTKGLIIGRNAANLRHLESIVQRYFDIKEIKVI